MEFLDAPFGEQIELVAFTDEAELAADILAPNARMTREQRIAFGLLVIDRYWTIALDSGFEAAGQAERYEDLRR